MDKEKDLPLSRIVNLAQWLAELEREVRKIYKDLRRIERMLKTSC